MNDDKRCMCCRKQFGDGKRERRHALSDAIDNRVRVVDIVDDDAKDRLSPATTCRCTDKGYW